jgi:excisionase family DNA binding protein
MHTIDRQWGDLKEAMSELGVSRSTIYNLLKAGKIKSAKINRLRRYHLPSLVGLIESGLDHKGFELMEKEASKQAAVA